MKVSEQLARILYRERYGEEPPENFSPVDYNWTWEEIKKGKEILEGKNIIEQEGVS